LDSPGISIPGLYLKFTQNKDYMKFQKGISGNPNGRPPGAKSLRPLIVQEFVETIAEEGMGKFREELNKLTGEAYLRTYLNFLEFTLGKKARNEVSGINGNPIEVTQAFKIDGTEFIF
jgi:hypothetical protein